MKGKERGDRGRERRERVTGRREKESDREIEREKEKGRSGYNDGRPRSSKLSDV